MREVISRVVGRGEVYHTDGRWIGLSGIGEMRSVDSRSLNGYRSDTYAACTNKLKEKTSTRAGKARMQYMNRRKYRNRDKDSD